MPLVSQAVRSRTTSQWSAEMQKTARFFTKAQSSTFANTFNEARSVYASDRLCLIWEVSLTHEDQFHCRQPSSFFPAGDDGIYGCVRCKVRAMRKWTNSKCHAHTLRFDQSFCGVWCRSSSRRYFCPPPIPHSVLIVPRSSLAKRHRS